MEVINEFETAIWNTKDLLRDINQRLDSIEGVLAQILARLPEKSS